MRSIILAVVMVGLSAVWSPSTAAQSPARMCATSAHNSSQAFAGIAKLFTSSGEDSAYVYLRQDLGIQTVATSDSMYVVTDATTCGQWMPAVETALAGVWGSANDLHAVDLGFYRVGSYLAVQVYFDLDINPQLREMSFRSPLLVFDYATQHFVADIMR